MASTTKQPITLNNALSTKRLDLKCRSASVIGRGILGGVAGTAAITMMMYLVAPIMMGEAMDVAKMLGTMLGDNWTAGMAMHLMNGIVIFPMMYVWVLYKFLPGAPMMRGITWGLGLWLLAQLAVMPMMGAGFFGGGMMPATGSMIGHFAYGAILGLITGRVSSAHCAADSYSNSASNLR